MVWAVIAIMPLIFAPITRPLIADCYLQKGVDYGNAGSLKDAIIFLNRSVSYDPHNMRAHFLKGRIIHEANNYQAAISSYRKASKLFPYYAFIYNNIGFAYFQMGDYHNSEQAYLQAIAIDPRHKNAHYNLGIVYIKDEKSDLAKKEFENVVAIDPEFAAAYGRLTQIAPLDKKPYLELGRIYHYQGMLDQAIENFNQVVKIDPDDKRAYDWLGQCYLERGDLEEAKKIFLNCLETDPLTKDEPLFWVHLQLGKLYYTEGSLDEAITELEMAIEPPSEYYEAYKFLAQCYEEKGLLEKAMFARERYDKKTDSTFSSSRAN